MRRKKESMWHRERRGKMMANENALDLFKVETERKEMIKTERRNVCCIIQKERSWSSEEKKRR